MLNRLLAWGGMSGRNWLGDIDTVLPALMVVTIWKEAGFFMIFYLAALQSISTEQLDAARLESPSAWYRLRRVVLELLSDHTELFKQFSDNPNFKRWLTDTVFDATYQQGTVPPKAPPQAGASA